MKRILIALVLISLAPWAVLADTVRPVPLGCYAISAFSTAQPLTTIPAGATFIQGSVETNNVRMRDDGTAPTSSVGVLYSVGNFFIVDTLGNLSFIPTTGSATINYCAYR